jgi:Zn2+/Cd2+-exporting ATPase
MGAKVKKELILEGLDCANCASKIEAQVSKLNGVSMASLNFVTKTLAIESDEWSNFDEIMSKTNEIIKSLEPQVVVKEKVVNKGTKKALVLMGMG